MRTDPYRRWPCGLHVSGVGLAVAATLAALASCGRGECPRVQPDDSLARTVEKACADARSRAMLALYSLRTWQGGDPDALENGGVMQAVELSAWMELCGFPGANAEMLSMLKLDRPPDIASMRELLQTFLPPQYAQPRRPGDAAGSDAGPPSTGTE